MFNQFKETYNNIATAIGYTKPLSYSEWVQLPDEYKAGALFVQFYEQITLAYLKTKTDAAIEEECVSEVLAYLTKNVYGDFVNKLHNQNKKIALKEFSKFKLMKLKNSRLVSTKVYKEKEIINGKSITHHFIHLVNCSNGEITFTSKIELPVADDGSLVFPQLFELNDYELINLLPDSKRVYYHFDETTTKIKERNFKPSYFYKVAYNCIYCKSIDYVKIPTTWYNNTCSNITSTSDGTELDLFDTIVDTSNPFEDKIMSNKLWSIIEDKDKTTKEVIKYLLLDEAIPAHLLNDSKNVIDTLRVELAEFREYYLGA